MSVCSSCFGTKTVLCFSCGGRKQYSRFESLGGQANSTCLICSGRGTVPCRLCGERHHYSGYSHSIAWGPNLISSVFLKKWNVVSGVC